MSDNIPPQLDELRRLMAAELATHWKLFLFQGVVMGVLGALAIVVPQVATLVVDIFVGWLFLVGGIVRGLTIFRTRSLPGTLWSVLAAILAVILGLLLILQPAQGVLTLTMVLVAFFIIQGIASILLALQFRTHLKTWGWTLFSGVVDLVLAYLIWKGWPDTASWAIGLLVGINMLFAGMALVFTALAARSGSPD
ncbi:MAG: HdeD family acid-resistance protein [Sneathiella sp.]|nr:HdeD family acid-resistance protein [Sneathiella sp.]